MRNEDFGYVDFFNDSPSWSTEIGIRKDIQKQVSPWFLRDIEIITNNDGNYFKVVVNLHLWTWLWFGRKHKQIKEKLEKRCFDFKPVGVRASIHVF